MSKTSLTDTDTCSYNISAAPFYYTFQPYQYANTYTYGEVGINAVGGTAGSYVRSDVIDVSSFLSGRDEILSRCNPPVPALDDVETQPLKMQNNDNVDMLISKYTREKKSSVGLSSVDYNRWQPGLSTEPQDLRFIIEDFAPQRGGMDTSNYSKLAWNAKVKYGAAFDGPDNSCATLLNPMRACGDECSEVDGYKVKATPLNGKPSNEPSYPFEGPTSEDIKRVGAMACGPNMFYGPKYEKGSCGPQPQQRVLNNFYS